jgi:hypothetical protein
MPNKRRKNDLPQDEEELQRMERENGILPEEEEKEKKRHPHEIMTPAGEDPREYMDEELTEQGYTETGLESLDEEENPHSNPDTGRKAA